MNILSLFSGAGGLDLGFEKVGFKTIWANEYDKEIWETFEKNFPHTKLDRRSIVNIPSDDIPEAVGLIGGPPCQSWNEAENVSGMLAGRHDGALENIKNHFIESGYDLSFKLLSAHDYNVPQDRKRVFFIGFRKDLNIRFEFPQEFSKKRFLQDVIFDLKDNALAAKNKTYTKGGECFIENHEYMTGDFSSMYMSRNRVRNWDEPSFTIQAGGRHAPLHPQAPKMEFVEQNKRIFVSNYEHFYRRLSVRECARIQTFPDAHKFYYTNLTAWYKMVGSAVPPNLAYYLAKKIAQYVREVLKEKKIRDKAFVLKDNHIESKQTACL